MKRFWTPELKTLAVEYAEANETRLGTWQHAAAAALPDGKLTACLRRLTITRYDTAILQSVLTITMRKFCEAYDDWARCAIGHRRLGTHCPVLMSEKSMSCFATGAGRSMCSLSWTASLLWPKRPCAWAVRRAVPAGHFAEFRH